MVDKLENPSSEEIEKLFLEGVAAHQANDLESAEKIYRKILAQQNDHEASINNLGAIMLQLGQAQQAVNLYQNALKSLPDSADILYNLGTVFRTHSMIDEAIIYLEKAIKAKPDNPKAYENLGVALKNKGRMDEAEKAFRNAISHRNDYAKAYHSLSLCRKYKSPDSEDALKIKELLSNKNLKDEDAIFLNFALGKIYDDCKEWDEAFYYYKAGNSIKNKISPFNKAQYDKALNIVMNLFNEEFFKEKKLKGNDSELPVFIIGMPRSGTTLVEQIISSHPEVYGAGELYKIREIGSKFVKSEINDEFINQQANEYLDYIKSLAKDNYSRISDKMPTNFNYLGFISCLFPNARIIHCTRNPLDTCLSNYFQYFAHGNEQSFSLEDIGFYYHEYLKIMDHWKSSLNLKMMEINYEELVSNKEEKSRELIDFLGLQWDDKCLESHKADRNVKTASVWQVRQPIHNKSVNKYKNYEKHLDSLKEVLGEDLLKKKDLAKDKSQKLNIEEAFLLGLDKKRRGYFSQAKKIFEEILKSNPNHIATLEQCGLILMKQGKPKEALEFFNKAIELNPENYSTYSYYAIAQHRLGNTEEAEKAHNKAIKLAPKEEGHSAYTNFANFLNDIKRHEEALKYYKRAHENMPNSIKKANSLLHQLQITCDWDEIEKIEKQTSNLIEEEIRKDDISPQILFYSIAISSDPAKSYELTKRYSDIIKKQVHSLKASFPFDKDHFDQDKITIGYISSDYGNHPISHLMLSLFGLHNREKFKVIAYSNSKVNRSIYRKKIMADCDEFVDIFGLNHLQAAEKIYNDKVNILIDLNGFTKGNRFNVLALKPAPIQISYLGFIGTSGADFIDYIITDKIVTPEEEQKYYTEKFIYMPHCFQVNDHKQEISKKSYKRKEFNLPEKAIVYCSFNNPYKIDPKIYDTWMNILQKVEGSVLWLASFNDPAIENLRKEAEARGINKERIIFADISLKKEHLSRLKLADIGLDTMLYNGGTTTSDALWAGIPVITLQGKTFASRMASSIVTNVGMEELVTKDLSNYEELAVKLGNNPNELKKVKDKLAKNIKTEPLFDTPRFAKNLDQAYSEIWQCYINGEQPSLKEITEK